MSALHPDDEAYLQAYFAADARRYDRKEWYRRPVRARVLAAVQARPGEAVLDVCTGTGEMALALARQGARVTAVDVSPTMLARARAKDPRGQVDWRLASATDLPFAAGAFAAAVLYMGLHCMPAPARAATLRELARVARERVVLLEPGIPHLPGGRWLAAAGGRWLDAPRWWQEFLAVDLVGLAQAAGLHLLRQESVYLGFYRLLVLRPAR